MTDREQVLEKALSLSAADRAFVADALEQCLPHAGFAIPEVAAAWAAEVERRIEAFERGSTKERPRNNFSITPSPLAGEGRVRGQKNGKLFLGRS